MDSGAALIGKANELHLAGDFVGAEAIYDQLLTQNHDNPGLMATMGTMYLQSQKYGLAIHLLHEAVKKTPQSDIYCNLGIAYKYCGQYDKAHKYFKKACDKNPSADALANYSALWINNGTPEKGIALANKSLKINPQCSMAHWNLAMALLESGQWETGWDEMEWGFEAKMRIKRDLGKPYWDGTKGKRIVVYGEQGLGDEIMFASMLPDLMKDNTVILECHRRLKTLFETAFPGLKCYGTREEKEPNWLDQEDFDYAVSIGTLGKYFRRSRDSFPGTPYLKADPVPRGEKFRVGISWTGGLKPGRVRVREIPLRWWKPILENDCEFVSLQYTECEEEIKAVNDLGYNIQFDPAVHADDYYETAKLVKSCDLVISCCTSVIHLAGALGVPTWVMVPSTPAWRYQVTGGMPFYRSVRLYRQPKEVGWKPVIDRVAADLTEKRWA